MRLEEHIKKTMKHLSRYNKKYIRNKIYDSTLRKKIESFRSRNNFERSYPGFKSCYIQDRTCIINEITPFYREYVSNISNEIMALSLELSVFLLIFCKYTQPVRILDFGSGFSSFLLRYYAQKSARSKPVIVSVDDSREWLVKTRGFLQDHNVDAENLFTIEEFKNLDANCFDLILYDFGPFDIRMSCLYSALDLLSPQGNIIIDDMHGADYALHVKDTAKIKNLETYSLFDFTIDEINRFSFLLRKP